MKIENAIKKCERAGGVNVSSNRFEFSYKFEGTRDRVEFIENGNEGEITCICTRREDDLVDSMSDYFPQIWHDNLTQAIDFAKRQ